MKSTTNTNQAAVNATVVVNPSNGEVKVLVASKKEEKATSSAKPITGFAKNTRYSIYNNGGGYTGL